MLLRISQVSIDGLRELTSADLLVLALIIIAWPIYATISLKRNPVEKLRKDPNVRTTSYAITIMQLWGFTAAILLVWFWLDRTPADLGFGHHFDMPTIFAWGVAFLGIVLSAHQLYQVSTTAEAREKVGKQLADVGEYTALLMPKTTREHRLSMLVGITAGITEEIIFRGYLIWAFSLFVHPWIAGLLSICAFVFLHRYQSRAGLIQVAIFALVTTVMYLACGSLWPGIILHIGVDMLNISLAWQVEKKSKN